MFYLHLLSQQSTFREMIQKNTFLTFLDQPYPFYYEGKKLLQILSVIFVISLFFNYMLQPFDVNVQEHKMDYFSISVIHSASPLFILWVMALILQGFPKMTDEWVVKKELILILLLILGTGITQFLIRDLIYENPLNWSWAYFKEEISNTFIAGLFLAPIIISINANRQQFRNRQKADHISSFLFQDKTPQNNTKISIDTEVKSEKFDFEIDDFIYAKAEGNYSEIFLKKENNIQKLIKRISIKNLEVQLNAYPHIIKTHRSILLNCHHIEAVTGNAQGYKVKLKDCSDTVPVSRNFIHSFELATTSP